MKSLKEIYNLPYDESNFGSGLIEWYNTLIDKSFEELNITDVSKMIRQNILKEIAVEKALDLFFNNPYDGEYQDGDLLSLLVTFNISEVDASKVRKLRDLLKDLKQEYLNFDWEELCTKELYAKDLNKLEEKITVSFLI